ncbi:hypothetical protein EDB89DRAFT_2099257, partial [Lactarius sanguifluus]
FFRLTHHTFSIIKTSLLFSFPLPPTLRARLYYVISSLTLVSLITVAVVLRPFWATLNDYSSYYCDVFGPSRSLRTWLAHEEARYAVAIQGRLELIKQ